MADMSPRELRRSLWMSFSNAINSLTSALVAWIAESSERKKEFLPFWIDADAFLSLLKWASLVFGVLWVVLLIWGVSLCVIAQCSEQKAEH